MAWKFKKYAGNQEEYTNGKVTIVYLGSGKGASVTGYRNNTGSPLGIAKGFTSKSSARKYLSKVKKNYS